MKARLMHPGLDFDPQAPRPPNEADLAADLELGTLVEAMAGGDEVVAASSRAALLLGTGEIDAIRHRQAVLRDALRLPALFQELYGTVTEALDSDRRVRTGLFGWTTEGRLSRSVEVLGLLLGSLRRLREIAGEHEHEAESSGLRALLRMLQAELAEDYLAEVEAHLRRLAPGRDILMSARLGRGSKGYGYVLRRRPDGRGDGMIARLKGRRAPHCTVTIADRDEAGLRALSELRERGVDLVANAVTQSAEHVLGFFSMLRSELAFYMGCLNLRGRLDALGHQTCFPDPLPPEERALSASGLYDVCLALQSGQAVVANDLGADGKDLVLVTGANRGGKSTFLRSVGLAQLMMQAGMFTGARTLRLSTCRSVFTHYKREEDAGLEVGKLDEELARMSRIVDEIEAGDVLLCNESFASTNEREGSEIADQIVSALVERGVRVFYVTHLYELARRVQERRDTNVLFLRAERKEDGSRTYRVLEAPPMETSYAADLYERLLGSGAGRAMRAGQQ